MNKGVPVNCPACNKELSPVTDTDGVTRYFCNCIGFYRSVIEVIPPALVEITAPAKGVKQK